ncbi:MAG: amidohydrolase family protein, partial [Acidobacteriaceae bacterium]
GALARQAIDAAPILTRVAAEFGAERLMWGSDITQSAGTYSYMVALAARATASLPAAMRRQVLYETAKAVYGRRG